MAQWPPAYCANVRSSARLPVLVVSAIVVMTTLAAADPSRPPAARTEFWREVIEPHGDEVKTLVTNARAAMKIVDDVMVADSEWAVSHRMRYFEDAYRLLRYARTRSPDNPEVLAALGRAADELGDTPQATAALEACLRIVGPDRVPPEVAGRLGSIYLRRGELDAAIRVLRLAQGGALRPETAHPLVYLATALALRGEMSAAIDLLSNALPTRQVPYQSQEIILIKFTLAMLYDRDEQRSAAFAVLESLQLTLQDSFGQQIRNSIATLRFAPAEDQLYVTGLLYEAQNQYVEARAQFALYAASEPIAWRERALAHVHALDALAREPRLRTVSPARPTPVPSTTP
jgi:tetratricopeptide (TPR) repeat protein